MKLSLIVCLYNTPKAYFDECLSSIKNSTLKKEDYEILIAYYLHDKFPTLGNLRGSAFIDVTVSEDGNNEVKVSQSLHPKIDKMALDLAKNIPWHLSDVKSKRKGTKYRLTIMYAKGKLWQVKMWNMD